MSNFFNIIAKGKWQWPTIPVFNWLLTWLESYYKADTNWSFPDSQWSNDWTISGATFNAVGKINWAYDFDATNDSIALWWVTSFWRLKTFSFSTWVKANTVTPAIAASIIKYVNASNDRWWMELETTWTISVALYNWSSFIWAAEVTLPDTNYHHLVWTFTNTWSVSTLYLDWVWTTAWTPTVATNTTTWVVLWARAWWTAVFDGWIDESWIWNKVLTSDEVLSLYNSGAWLSYDLFN